MRNKKYPDVTGLLKQKMRRRRRLARLSFEEKIAVVDKWRKLTRTIRKARGLRIHLSVAPDDRSEEY
ncbi:MAG: hypothetical protein H0V18_00975 [Pyrinomonadaceae bacterium]|nr:hypothetical protein [Pyrinomonadaceae bacterium]